MGANQILNLVEGTADAAFAIDWLGSISAWNKVAEELFGLSSREAIGRACHEVLQGTDEGGRMCSEHCRVQRAVQTNSPVANFDLQVQTDAGRQWCNISVLIVTGPGSPSPHALHIVRPREMRKRLEQLLRDFVVTQTEPGTDVPRLIPSRRAVADDLKLTHRETEILRILARGTSTAEIASQLYISPATVNKHIANILTKLDAHTRLAAIRRAEKAGLL